MKKTVSLILALILCVCSCIVFASCNETTQDGGKYTVGVIQVVTHPALDAATEGFVQALKDKLGEENVEIDIQNAANSTDTCATIANNRALLS